MSEENNRMKQSQRQAEVDGVTGQISGRRGRIYLAATAAAAAARGRDSSQGRK